MKYVAATRGSSRNRRMERGALQAACMRANCDCVLTIRSWMDFLLAANLLFTQVVRCISTAICIVRGIVSNTDAEI